MKSVFNPIILAVVVMTLVACDKNEDKVVELIDVLYSQEMITRSLTALDSTEGHRHLIEKLCESGVEWHEDVWFYSMAKYPDTETLEDPIFSLHGYPVIEIPAEVERYGFQFFEDGRLSVWILDKEGKKGELMFGEWSCDATDGTLQMNYTDLNGALCAKSGILEAIWWNRCMVVTIFDPNGAVNYYVWQRKWHSGNLEN